MAATYLTLTPYARDDDSDPLAPRRMRSDSSFNTVEQIWRRKDAETVRYAGMDPAERARMQAVDRVERDFAQNFGDYSRTTLQDTLDGYYDFSTRLEQSFDKARAAVPTAHRDAVNCDLDLLQRTAVDMGLDHWHRQNQALTQYWAEQRRLRDQASNQQRIQLAQADTGTVADGAIGIIDGRQRPEMIDYPQKQGIAQNQLPDQKKPARAIPGSQPKTNDRPTERERAYFDKYPFPISRLAKEYGVNPAFVLALGFESGYATAGTYKITG